MSKTILDSTQVNVRQDLEAIGTEKFAELEEVLVSLDAIKGTLKASPASPVSKRVKISAAVTAKPNGAGSASLAGNRLSNFAGAEIDFSTGQIFEADGTTLISTFTPVALAADEYVAYAISLQPSTVNPKNLADMSIALSAGANNLVLGDLVSPAFLPGVAVAEVIVKKDSSNTDIEDIGWENIVEISESGAAGAVSSRFGAHETASEEVHGLGPSDGEVVGTAKAQTLTNKIVSGADIVSPVRSEVKKDTLANLAAYANASTNGQLVFATDTKEMFQVIDGALSPFGGGGDGVVGDVKQSALNEAEFQARHSAGWVLMRGQDITGTTLEAIMGITRLPDMRGKFIRSAVSVVDRSFLPADVSVANNAITVTGHEYSTGFKVRIFGRGVPAGISLDQTYYAIAVDADTIRLATSYSDALLGSFVTITTAGTGADLILRQWEAPDQVASRKQLSILNTNVNISTETITSTDHGLLTGMEVRVVGGTTPGGTVIQRSYWVIKENDNQFKLAANPANASNNIAVNLTTATTFTLQNVTHINMAESDGFEEGSIESHDHLVMNGSGGDNTNALTATRGFSGMNGETSYQDLRRLQKTGGAETRPANFSIFSTFIKVN